MPRFAPGIWRLPILKRGEALLIEVSADLKCQVVVVKREKAGSNPGLFDACVSLGAYALR